MTEYHATRPVFGRSLESHLKQMDREISVVIEECVNILHHSALEEEVRHQSIKSSICKAQLKVVQPVVGIHYSTEQF